VAESEIIAKANTGDGTEKLLTFTNGLGRNAGGVVAVDENGNPVPLATATGQEAGNGSLANIELATGLPADEAATTDTGTFSLLAFVKRGLQNWTTLLARIPALVGGRIPVDGSGVTQPVSGFVGISGSVAVTGSLKDTQLRASAVAVSLTSTTITGSVAVTGPLTDTQLRATPVPVSGTVAATQSGTWNIGSIASLPALPVGTNTIGAVNVNKQATTASAPTTATIGVASGTALATNANRKGAYLKNTSTTGQRISIAFSGGTAVLDSGITLEVGDAYFMGEYDFTTGAINAIASAASARLSVQEWA